MDDLTGDTSTATMDYTESADRISGMLGEELIGKQSDPVESPGLPQPRQEQVNAPQVPPAPQTYDVPKSWKKDMHAHWGKVAPEAQAYIIEREKQLLDGFQTYRPIQDAITPYMDWLQRSNIRPEQAVQSLFNAHMRLTQGSMEQRRAALKQLQQSLGLMEESAQAQPQQSPVAPEIQTLQQKLDAIEQQNRALFESQKSALMQQNMKLINDFAADTKAHPYFEEVGDEMAAYLSQHPGASLQEAYEKAVRLNEAVWAKEQARLLTEAEAKWKENARLASLPKRKAASVNIQSDRDGQEPTEPLGSFEDTIRSEHKRIKARS